MTRAQVKEVLDRVLSWPPERQADAVLMLADMEAQDASDLHLTEQVAEVERRLADPNPKFLTLERSAGALCAQASMRVIIPEDAKRDLDRIHD